MPYKGTVGGATCGERVELHVSWKVKNFFSLSTEVDDVYYSPDFHFLGRSFRLSLYPGGISRYRSEGWIGLFLMLEEWCPPMEVEFTLGIQTPEGKLEYPRKYTYKFQDMNIGFGLPEYLKRSDLSVRRQELAPSDAVIFTVAMKKNAPQSISSCEKVAEDLAKLWSSSVNSDVVVKVGDFEFKAHRAILGARTPVLRAMFNHDTEEKESSLVTITDCQPKIFEEFLHYIYTGSPRELTTEHAFGLYALADKYLVDNLKTQCSKYIRNTLCVDTFCDAAQLALTHGEAKLLEEAVDFAAENIRLIIKSVEWKKFLGEHPAEANEVLIKALGPHEIRK